MKEKQEINVSEKLNNDLKWFCGHPDCPGHRIGEGPCSDTEIPKPKAIVLCLHGMAGGINSFNEFEARLNQDFSSKGVFMDLFMTEYTGVDQLRERVQGKKILMEKFYLLKQYFQINMVMYLINH